MHFRVIAATSLVALVAACTQPEPVPPPVYVQPAFDKFGNVVNGTIVDGVFVLNDGTVVGPVGPVVDPDADDNRNRERDQTQTQTTTTTTTTTQTRGRSGS